MDMAFKSWLSISKDGWGGWKMARQHYSVSQNQDKTKTKIENKNKNAKISVVSPSPVVVNGTAPHLPCLPWPGSRIQYGFTCIRWTLAETRLDIA
jgi:hypothetical protein